MFTIYYKLQIIYYKLYLQFRNKNLFKYLNIILIIFFTSIILLGNIFKVNSATTNIEDFSKGNNCWLKGSQPTLRSSNTDSGSYPSLLNSFTTYILPECVKTTGVKVANADGTITTTIVKEYSGGGILQKGEDTIAMMYKNKPLDTKYEVDSFLAKVDPIKKVNAAVVGQISGETYLSVIKSMHTTVQNLAFTIYIFIFLFIAFAIMFRKKLSGQQYVTVANSIPKIIISLIFVVFSYPIAAGMIDAGNVGYSVVYNALLKDLKPVANSKCSGQPSLEDCVKNEFPNPESNLSPASTTMSVFQIYGTSKAGKVGTQVGNLDIVEINAGDNGQVANVFSSLANGILAMGTKGANAASTENSTFNSLLVLILCVAALYSMFKLFFVLLKDYFFLIFMPIFSPFTFALSALPGQDKNISQWFINYSASILSFVAVYAIFILMVLFGGGYMYPGNPEFLPIPALLGMQAAPDITFFLSLMSYALFIIAPMVPEQIKKALKTTDLIKPYADEVSKATRAATSRVTLGAVG